MTLTEFFLYLIYGFAMVTMGIFAIVQKDSPKVNLSLIKSLKYLGYFGITHGISEWVSMAGKLELCQVQINPTLCTLNLVLKAISFAFLLYFGLDLLPIREKYKKYVLKIPSLYFIVYLTGFLLLLINYGPDYHLVNPQYTIITMRYLLGFPSCAISAAALYINSWLIKKTKTESIQISRRYVNLAWVFVIYGILEGLLVSKADFFPANILYKEIFIEYLNFSPLFIKAFVGFVINFLLMKVSDTFRWEEEEKLNQLEKLRIAAEERRKLGLELHDAIIQGLFAVGLKIEYLAKNPDKEREKDILEQVKNDLNNTIQKTREFISSNALDCIQCEELKENLEQLIQNFNANQTIKINFTCKISPYNIGHISPEKSTQIYYVIQEALTNIIKHSDAAKAEVLLEGRHDYMYITVIDNGKGISNDKWNFNNSFGIKSMKERTERIGGFFSVERIKRGTRIELRVPWEETSNGKEN